jgi:hypothetical protein
MLRRILKAIRRVANILAEMTGQMFDFHLAFARHWTARFRRRFVNTDLGVFSLADEVDFAKFCRDLKKPTDPELEVWREWNDPFEGFESGTKFFH